MADPPHKPSRFARRPGPNADPFTRRDEIVAFSGAAGEAWSALPWFEQVEVVLYEPTDPVNIGVVVRAMSNTGFSRLRLVNPVEYDVWDVVGVAHYTQHILGAVQRFSILPAAIADAHHVIALSGRHHRHHFNATPFPEMLRRAADWAASGERVLLVYGREDTGLPTSALDHCHFVSTIPTNPANPSLNLAQAVFLTLYGLFQLAGGDQQVYRPPRRSGPPAPAAALEALYADLERALEAVEFLKTRSREGTLRSFRSVFARAELDTREAALLRAAFIEVRKFLQRKGLASSMD